MTEQQALQAASATDANEMEKLLTEAEVTPQSDGGDQPPPPAAPPPDDQQPPAPAPPPEPKVEPQTPEVKTDDELEKELEQYKVPETAHRNTKETVKVLKEAVRKKSAAARELQEKLAKEEEGKKSIKVLTPEIEQQLAELQKTRDELTQTLRIKDSEGFIKKQFTPVITQLETEAVNLLKAWGTSEEVSKFIADSGGVNEVMFSHELMPDGRTTREDWFKSQIVDAMTPRQKFEFDSRLRVISDKKAEQTRAIDSAKQDSERFQTEQQQIVEQGRKQWTDRFDKARQEIMKTVGPEGQKKEVPIKATPEEKAAIEEHNKWLDESENFAQTAMRATEPEHVAQITVMAGAANYMSNIIEKQNQKINTLEKEIKTRDDKLAAITKARLTGRLTNAPPAPSSPPNPTLKPISDADAIEVELRKSENQ